MLKFSVLFHISTESSKNHERHLDTLRQFTRDLKKDLHDQVSLASCVSFVKSLVMNWSISAYFVFIEY